MDKLDIPNSQVDTLKLMSRLQRSLRRAKKRLEELEENKANLSGAGHWSLGYYRGVVSQIENTLDLIEDLSS